MEKSHIHIYHLKGRVYQWKVIKNIKTGKDSVFDDYEVK